MTFEEMKKRKQELHYTNEMIAELSGVPLSTVQKIFSGATKYPRLGTMVALGKVLKEDQPYRVNENGDLVRVQEDQIPYHYSKDSAAVINGKRQGEFTVDDYRSLPDGPRYELIDGVLYQLNAPTTEHQAVLFDLAMAFGSYIKSQNGECRPFFAPLDVQLDCDEYTMLQPDFLVVCDPDKIKDWGIWGAPDLTLEVLSSSTRNKDIVQKLRKYKQAGVREYWIVDLEEHIVITYLFGEKTYTGIYGFESRIPVGIYGGDLEIDFNEIITER